MVFLTFLSFLQMCVLPGLAFIQLAGVKNIGIIKYLATVFFASVVLNYGIITVLILLGIYNLYAVVILMVMECAVALWNPRKSIPNFYKINFKDNFCFISTVVFMSIFFVVVSSIINAAPKIFNWWDDVVSWNRWAQSFWKGKIPIDTGHYPQAIPAWWSVCYVLCGEALEFLPKACMPLFLLFVTLSLVESGLEKRNISYLIASVFILTLFYRTGYVNTGYVDIPVSCTAFFAFVLLIDAIEKSDDKILMLGAVFALASTLIKQAGIFAAAGYFVFSLIFFKFGKNDSSGKISITDADKNFGVAKKILKNKLVFTLFYVSLCVIIVLPFYGFTQINILQGKNGSEISYVTNGIYAGEAVASRMVRAFKSFFFSDIKSLRILLLLVCPFIFVQKNNFIKSLGIFGICYWLLWSAFYSYDTRNGFLSWSFMAFSGTAGFFEFIATAKKLWNVNDTKSFSGKIFALRKFLFDHIRIAAVICFVLVSAMSFLLSIKIDRKFLYDKQELRKMERGGQTGLFIENYIKQNGMTGKFLSNFQLLDYMAENSVARSHYAGWMFNDIEHNTKTILNENIEYLCVAWGDTGEAFKKYFEKKVDEGVFEILFDTGGQVFVRITNKEAL